eukprot:8372783-Heterocapsa_arctica.AAC.1
MTICEITPNGLFIIARSGREEDPGHRGPSVSLENRGRAEMGTASSHELTSLPLASDARGLDA